MSHTLNESTRTAGAGAARPTDVPVPHARAADSFVPLRREALIELLVRHGELDDAGRTQFRKLCGRVEAVIHHEFHTRQEQLKRLYAPFDPDSDSRPVQRGGNASHWDMLEEFFGGLVCVLEAANFRPLTEQELDRALSSSTYLGLDLQIDRDIFERMMIFVRGEGTLSRVRWDLSTWFRPRHVELEIFDRLVLAVKLKTSDSAKASIDTENVYLKMFREIPKLDIEMLLPGTRPRMRWFDATKIGGSSLGGLYGLAKLWMIPGVKWFMIAIGAFSYAMQSFIGYRRTKDEYVYSMTQQLYYQNLDNNAGVFCRLIDEAEDEETKEALLAYFILWRHSGEAWTPDQLADEVEKLVREKTGDRCEFQAREAIAKLERLGLMRQDSDQLRVLDPQEACKRLGERATKFFSAEPD